MPLTVSHLSTGTEIFNIRSCNTESFYSSNLDLKYQGTLGDVIAIYLIFIIIYNEKGLILGPERK